MEHEFPSNFLASAQYLGSRGVHLFSRGAVNLCNDTAYFQPDRWRLRRYLDQFYPDPDDRDPFGSVDIKRDIGASTYNALGLALERRFSQGLEFPGSLHLVPLNQRRVSRRRRVERPAECKLHRMRQRTQHLRRPA